MPHSLLLEDVPVPENFQDEAHLEDYMSTPPRALMEDLAKLEGDIAVLGVGGKVGPMLATMAKRAAPEKRVFGVARFTDPAVRERLETAGVETIVCDLLEREQLAQLPDANNVVYMAGKKFGTAGSEPQTWAMNTIVPTHVAERFDGTRFVAFSTLCVYPFSKVQGPGATPQDTPPTPTGEYANSCVGRERIFQYYSQRSNSPGCLARLNYAIDCRYGVLHDLGRWVRNGTPIDIRTSVANCIWQGDAIAQILRCLRHGTVPAQPINIGTPQTTDIRAAAERFGELFGTPPKFQGVAETTAWHNDCTPALDLFGPPAIDLETMIRWNADWIARGLVSHEKPTHYEERSGKF